MKKPGAQNDDAEEKTTSPVGILAELLVNLIPFNKLF